MITIWLISTVLAAIISGIISLVIGSACVIVNVWEFIKRKVGK